MNTDNVSILAKEKKVYKPIYNISPFTLLDFPDKTACILWFAGCNMSCLYCYNPEIVKGKGSIPYEDALRFLHSRKKLLDGVVLSGGECTMHHGILEFIEEVKAMDMMVKIDTNGTNPTLIKRLVANNLIDFIALDFKAPRSSFSYITSSTEFDKFEETLDFLIEENFPFEVRSTVHSSLHTTMDMNEMIQVLNIKKYKGIYKIQNFLNNTPTLFDLPAVSEKVNVYDLVTNGMPVVIRN